MNPVYPLLLPLLLAVAPVADGWLGVYLDPERTEAVVSEVIPDSPAAKAGLKAGDVLLAVDDQATATGEEFAKAIRSHQAGDRVRIKLRRGDKEQTVAVKLGEHSADASPLPQPTKPLPPEPGDNKVERKPPVPPRPAAESKRVEPRAGGRSPYLGLSVRSTDGGVVIERIVEDGPAKETSLRAGDRITSIAEKPVQSLADIDGILGTLAPGQKVTIGVRRDSGVASVTLTLGERGADGAAAEAPRAATKARAPESKPPADAPKEPKEPPKKVEKWKSQEGRDVDAEIEALRRELKELRKELEELRKQSGR